MHDITDIYCDVDNFLKGFTNDLKKLTTISSNRQRCRKSKLSYSEVMTIMILFHSASFRNLKHFYNDFVCKYLQKEFPELVSYGQFTRLQQQILLPLCAYLKTKTGKVTGISFVDSTPIAVCKNLRIKRNKVFKGIAQRGKSTTGWFYGFKLNIIVNELGELLNFSVTPGNYDDRKPLPTLAKGLVGKLFADRGYLSQKLFDELFKSGVQLITTLKKNMKNKLIPIADKLLLRKRFIIETINDPLKNMQYIEHSRHRSTTNFMVNIVAALASYCHQPKKPSIRSLYNSSNTTILTCN